MKTDIITPTEIPWKELKNKELEELLYWLLDEMGAKELTWRIGSNGTGTSDGGRDLETVFHVSSPDGCMVKQQWWIEAKGRANTVEPEAVKLAVINCASKIDLDVLVIATNSAFSNPTRDWVKDWQLSHPRPIVKLWERTELENLCSKNPTAVARLFRKALNSSGKLEVAKSKFWNYSNFADEPTLSELWKDRSDLKIDESSLISLIASEYANGNPSQRAWGALVDTHILEHSLQTGLINYAYLQIRSAENGINSFPIIRAIANIVEICILRIGLDKTTTTLKHIWGALEDDYPADFMKSLALKPILNVIFNETRDLCTKKCTRVSTSQDMILKDGEHETFHQRFIVSDIEPESERVLTIERHDGKCELGLNLNKDIGCPFCNIEHPQHDIDEAIRYVDLAFKRLLIPKIGETK